MCSQVLIVDDDNKPDPMNIPVEQVSFAHLFEDQIWGYDGIDCRASSVPIDQKLAFQGRWRLANKSFLEMFKKMLPYNYYLEVVVKSTSDT